ncbi:hypothetical protein FDECE_16803, partial [Fusarium decemcellulare]
MPAEEFNPGEVITLLSSDDETSPAPKKRSLEDAQGSNSSDAEPASAPDPKRLKTGPVPNAELEFAVVGVQDTEEGQVDRYDLRSANKSSPKEVSAEQPKKVKSIADSAGVNKASTQASTSSEPALGTAGEYPVFRTGSLSFKIPDLADKKEGSWVNRFKDWVRAFQALNSEQSHAITTTLAQSAYANYIDNHAGLKPKKRRSAKQVAKEVESTGELGALLGTPQPKPLQQPTIDNWFKKQPREQPSRKTKRKGSGKSSRASSISEGEIADEADESEAEYEPTLSKDEQVRGAAPSSNERASPLSNSAQTNGKPPPDTNQTSASSNVQNLPIDTHRNVPVGSEALEQQHRYFPSASDPTRMCLLCGQSTHLAPSCPTLICSLCGSLEHPDLCCPTLERCDKCRQLGHQAAQCTEKLALTKDEGLACAICSSADHLEKHCTQAWRSFHPDALTVRKVAFIPATCSSCGSDGHFSADCSRRRDDGRNPTWSVKNRDQYVDPDCGLVAIEELAGGPQNARTARAPELKIRGHASRTTNVHYSESDDSDVEFLGHKPVKKRAPLGQIRMASNIQMPQSANGRPARGGRQNGT